MKNIYIFTATLFLLIGYGNISAANQNKLSSKDIIDLKQLVYSWNKANVLQNVSDLNNLYDKSVLFYGTLIDKNKCIKKKLSLFKKYPNFHQEIVGDIQIEKGNDNSVKCSFLKRVTINKKRKDYPSYLIFKNVDNQWKIIAESDLITDRNLSDKRGIDIPEGAIKGDFNGDGKREYVWLVLPKLPKERGEDNFGMCDGECECYLKFSDDKIPSIKISDCIGGIPVNEGDLNDDGADEIGLLPDWWTSCWRDYQVFTLRENRWKHAVEPFATHCSHWDNDDFDPIKKDESKKGYVIIQHTYYTDEGNITSFKSIPVLK